MPICNSCGKNYEDTFQFCPHCGKPKPVEEMQKPCSQNSCPKCGLTDKIEKVSEIRRSQIQHLEGTMPVSRSYSDNNGDVRSYTGYRNFSGTQSTNLAEALTPPSAPQIVKEHQAGTWWLLVLMIYFGIAAIGLPIAFIATSGSGLGILALVIMAGLWIFFISKWNARFNREKATYKERLSSFKEEQRSFELAMQNWRNLMYCYRDGCVFLPGQSTSAPIDAMNEYIYRPENY
jgi:hypothetical protein